MTSATPKPRAGEHMKWGAMAVGDEGALIFHWRATGMSSDGGIGDYVELRAHQRLLAERDLLRERERELVGLLELAERLRPAMLKSFGCVPEYVLDFCNRARALAKHGR